MQREGSRFIAERINGKYWMYFNDTGLMLATSDNLADWNVLEDASGKHLTVLPMRPAGSTAWSQKEGRRPPDGQGNLHDLQRGRERAAGSRVDGTVWAVAQALFDPKDPTKLMTAWTRLLPSGAGFRDQARGFG